MESYPDSIGSSEDEVCHGSSSFRLQPDSSQSPRMDPATENIRKIHSQVQACIDSTSMQLKNDYQHRAALYQAWCPPTRGSARANTSPIIQPRRPGSIGNSPRGNVGGMWGLGQHPTYMQQQQQPPEGSQGSLNASSFADFFRSRRSGSASNLDALRPSPMPFIQALVQDVRASREAANGRPVSPLQLKRLLDTKATTPLLLEKMRQQGAQQEVSVGRNIRNSSPIRGQGSVGAQNSAASVMTVSAAAVPGALSAGRGSSSLGELSLWGEPLNVSPVSPHRSAAPGSPLGLSSHAEGSCLTQQQQQPRPQSPTVLAMLATEHNIAPPVVLGPGLDSWGADAGAYAIGGSLCESPADGTACCHTRSCSPAGYSSAAGQQVGLAGRSRSCTPQPRQLICCGCRREHTLQQHSKCCHLCGSCCKGRGTCGTKSSIAASISGSGCAAAGSRGVSAGGMQGTIPAEPSAASSTSTCPCIKAYRKGHWDALQASGSPVRPSTACAAMPAAQAQPSSARLLASQQLHAMQQQPQDMQQPDLPSCSQAGAASYGGHRSAEGASAAQRLGYSAADLSDRDEGPAAPAPVPVAVPAAATTNPDDLVQTAFLEVFAAQQNLLAQGPAADPQDIEELTQILQQVLPAAEPKHEQLLKDVLGRQQQLLTMQEAYLADIEAEAGVPWSQAPPLRLPSGLGQGRSAAGSPPASVANVSPRQQRPGASSDYEGFGTRIGSTSSKITSSSAGQRAAYVTQQDLQGYMSKEDRLAAAAAAYEAANGGQKPLQQVLDAARGTAGSRSSRGRWASGASTVDAHTGYPAAGSQQRSPRTAQHYHPAKAHQQQQQGGSGCDNDRAPAYTSDGSDLELDYHVRPLVHYMTAQGSGSRHVVQESSTQVHEGRPPFDRASSAAAGPGPGPVRAPSIADSAWSVQATPPASSNGAQQVQCSPLIHAAMEPEPWAPSVGFTHAGAGASSRNGRHPSINTSSSSACHPAALLVEQVSAVVPPLSLGGALDTESAKLAGIAVDPRVMGLSPRLRNVDSAGCLQELAAAMCMNSDSRGRSIEAGSVQGLSIGGKAPSPRTPGRPVLGATVAAAGPAGHSDMAGVSGRGADACSSLSHRSVSVRFNQSSIGSEACPSPGSLSCPAVGHVQQQQQPWSPMQQGQQQEQQQEQFKRSVSSRAGSFDLPESNPTSQENSYKSLEELHEQADLAKSRQPVAAAAATADAATAKGQAPSARANGPQQSLAGPHQGVAVQQRAPDMLSPRAISLHNQLQQQLHPKQLQHGHSNLSCASSLLDLAARARVLASGGGGSRHSAAAAMSPRLRSPFSPGSGMQSPKAGNLAAAAAAAAALPSGGGAGVDKAAGRAQSPRVPGQGPQAGVATGSAGSGADCVHQQQQDGRPSAGSLAKADSSVSWWERQLAMQQELAAQQQQLSHMRSRASSVATTPVGASMLRSMSRVSDFSTIASSMTGAATPRDIQQQQQQQVFQQQVAQQPQQQHISAGAGHKPHQEQQQHVDSRSDGGSVDSIVDSLLGDALQQRKEARMQKQVLQGWRHYSAARKARLSSKPPEPASCQSPPIKQSPQQQQQQQQTPADEQQQHSQQPIRPGSGQALRISLQGLNRAVLKQSLGQLLQGQLQEGAKTYAASDNDSLELVVSGQLRLSSPPRQHSPSPGPRHRPHSASAGSSVSHTSSSNETIRRFEQQLEATRAAVTAAATTAGRAPLQGVLRDMHSMISRMEAVCTNSWQEGAAAAAAAAGASPQKAAPQQGHRQSAQHQPAQQCLQQKGASAAGRSRSPAPNMAAQLLHASPWRPGSAGSMSDWQQQTGTGSPQPCAQAYSRSRSPCRQPAAASPAKSLMRSPDRHKLRGRLRQVQDRLAKLEIKMNQASAMTEPCSCNAAGCVHRLSSPRAGCAYGEQEFAGSGACCCSLQGKRAVLVGRMQQELEDLQQELCNMHTMMPGAYSSSSGG